MEIYFFKSRQNNTISKGGKIMHHWVKIGQLSSTYISISEQKIKELIDKSIWKEGVHYVSNPHINHRLFNLEAIEQWLIDNTPNSPSPKMQELLKGW